MHSFNFNKMIKKLLLSIFILSNFSLMAQTDSRVKSDPEAKKILEVVSAKFKTYQSASANFSLKIENTEGKLIGNETGAVQMKGDKYRILTADRQIFSDGKTIWAYEIADREVQVSTYDPKSDVMTPQKMFTNFYDDDFLYKLNDDQKVGNKFFTQIELTPLDKTNLFFKLLVDIDKATKNIASLKVFEKNGNRYTYTVTSFTSNVPLADSLFVFDKKSYPNVEIVDLR